jgi:membrane fusion protein, multidrug efflux system
MLAASALLALSGCNPPPPLAQQAPPKVTVARPITAPVQPAAELTGQTAASQSVDLVARVAGFLREVSFADGADVKKDQALFLIEPEPYQAQVALAQATVAQHEATLKSFEAEFTRQETLQKQAISTEANYDKALANRDAERAAVAEAKANLQIAQINLGYTAITAPFSGRIGRHLVDVGNLVGQGSATKLATLSNVDPIYAYFTVNERDILRVRSVMAAKGIGREQANRMPVEAGLTGEAGTPHQGHLDFVDTGLDPTTGTMQLRAVFPNAKGTLLPGLFVRLRIPLGDPAPAMMIPETALSSDQGGAYVSVVDGAGKVAQKRVVTGIPYGPLRVIASGLAPTDRVVIDGLQYAAPGRPVTAVDGTIAAPAP